MESATERQDRYGHRFGDDSYTPEIVVDGASSHVGSYRREVATAIEAAKSRSETAAAVSVTRDGDRLSIEVSGGNGSGRLLLIGFDHNHQTSIRRGENSGRTLEEANVVRSIRTVGDWQGKPLRISERFPEGQDVAVILEAPGGRIVGASRLSWRRLTDGSWGGNALSQFPANSENNREISEYWRPTASSRPRKAL